MPSAQDLSDAIQNIWNATASGNAASLNEKIREFDLTFGLEKDKFADDIRRFNQNFALTQAGTTGYYGAPGTGKFVSRADGLIGQLMTDGTIQAYGSWGDFLAHGGTQAAANEALANPLDTATYNARAQAFQPNAPTMAREQQEYAQRMGMIQQAAALQANPFRQAEVTGQLGNLLRGQGVAGFQAPGQATGQTDFSAMGNMQRLIDDIRGGPGAINSQTVQQSLDMIPTPNKLNSADFFRSDPNTQRIILSGMQQKYGLDPENALNQIKATLPAFTAPSTFGQVRG